nr:hypothetical protein [Tanacetum cinerariifolium]
MSTASHLETKRIKRDDTFRVQKVRSTNNPRPEIKLSVEKPLSAGLRGEEDQLSAKHQLAVKGLSECKASESNIRRNQVKDIVKKVEYNLKSYSSAGWISAGISTRSPSSPNANRVDMMPNIDTTDTTTTNIARNVVEKNNDDLPQLLDSRGGSHVTNVPAFDKDDFTSWKIKFLVFLDDLEPYLITTLEDGPFVPILAALYGKYHYKEGLIDDIYAFKTQRFTIHASSSKVLISNNHSQDSDSNVKEDNRTTNEFMAYLNAGYHERDLLANQKRFYKRSGTRIDELTKGKNDKGNGNKGKSDKGLIAESFDWDDESVSLEDERTTKFKAFMAIAKDEPSVGKDHNHVDLHYVEDQRKNLVNKFNALKQDLALHKSKLCNLKNNVSINCSFQNEVIRVNLENESLKDEIFDLKKVIDKWTCSKVTLDQLLSKQIPGNIVKALEGKGKRKENNSPKEVIFTKVDVSTSESTPMITTDSEDDCDNQVPLPPLPKLTGVEPSGALKSLISLSDLITNMVDLTLNTASKKVKNSSDKMSQTYVIKKKTKPRHPTAHNSCFDKNALPSTEQLFCNSDGRSKMYQKSNSDPFRHFFISFSGQ